MPKAREISRLPTRPSAVPMNSTICASDGRPFAPLATASGVRLGWRRLDFASLERRLLGGFPCGSFLCFCIEKSNRFFARDCFRRLAVGQGRIDLAPLLVRTVAARHRLNDTASWQLPKLAHGAWAA